MITQESRKVKYFNYIKHLKIMGHKKPVKIAASTFLTGFYEIFYILYLCFNLNNAELCQVLGLIRTKTGKISKRPANILNVSKSLES